MPDEYKSSDTVEAYRRYYIGAKAKFATWRNAAPSWWKEPSMNLTPSLQIIAKQNVIKAKVARPSDLSEKEPPVYFAPGIFDDVTASAFPALEEEGYITKNPKGKFYLTDKGIAEADKVFDSLPMENLKLSELQAKYDGMEGNKGSKFRKKADAIAAIMALSEGKEEPEMPVQGARKGAGRPKKDGIIRIIQVENPKKPGSKAHHKYSLYRDGMTISEYLAAGGTRDDLNWDNDREFIRVEELPEAAE